MIDFKMKLPPADSKLNPEDVHSILEAEQVLEMMGSYVGVSD